MRKRLKREGLPPPSDSSLWLLRAFTQDPYSVLILGPETGKVFRAAGGLRMTNASLGVATDPLPPVHKPCDLAEADQ